MNPIFGDISLEQLGGLVVGIAIVAGAVIALIAMNRKTVVKLDDNPPPEYRKAQKRYNHDLAESRHSEVTRQLASHDAELNSIWSTLRSEDEAIRVELRNSQEKIYRSLGRIEGRLGTNHQEVL